MQINNSMIVKNAVQIWAKQILKKAISKTSVTLKNKSIRNDLV